MKKKKGSEQELCDRKVKVGTVLQISSLKLGIGQRNRFSPDKQEKSTRTNLRYFLGKMEKGGVNLRMSLEMKGGNREQRALSNQKNNGNSSFLIFKHKQINSIRRFTHHQKERWKGPQEVI